MRKITLSLFVALLTLLSTLAIAQGQTEILDFSVIPAMTTENPSPVDSIELAVSFKIKNAPYGGKAVVRFGTSQNSGNIMQVMAPFVFEQNKWFITYNGQKNEVINYKAKITAKLTSQQFQAYEWITLFIANSTGQITPPLFLNK